MYLHRGGGWNGGGWNTTLQKNCELHEWPNRPYQWSFLTVIPSKYCQIDSQHQYPLCWRFSASWLLVS